MKLPSLRAPTGALLWLLLLPGCALQTLQNSGIGPYLDNHGLEDTLTQLQARPPARRDHALYLLNRGMLHHLLGHYGASNADLEQAKGILEQVQAASITEGIAAATLNDTLSDYDATPSERVLLHSLMALNFLALNDLEGARVEALQADLRMRELASEDAELASARFIAALVFELNREWSDALIGYRKAAEILSARKQAIPRPLQQRLLQLTQRLGLSDEHQRWRERFVPGDGSDAAQADTQSVSDSSGQGELLVLYFNGKVPTLQQRMLSLFVPSLNHHVTVAELFYPPAQTPPATTRLRINEYHLEVERLEDLDQLARQALDAGQAKRRALTMARVVAKHQVVKSTRKKDPLLGALTDLAAILTEVADTRSWNLLPASLQVGSL
ncbi:MAG TPA: hypothetical protein VIS52_07615, partial [Motiliproteus sp.]